MSDVWLYDEQEEPVVLPAALPNLLLNGSAGIAVAIATKIPPHNMIEVVAALKALIKDPAISTAELMQHIPAPDFPTGTTLAYHKIVCPYLMHCAPA